MTTRRDVLKSAAAVMAGSFLPYAGSAPAAQKPSAPLCAKRKAYLPDLIFSRDEAKIREPQHMVLSK